MRLSRLVINNFRVFSGQYIFDFSNKQLILIGGQNGHGKSSLFDAIQWCLTGEIRRYRGSSEYQNFNYLINEYALANGGKRIDAYVEVWLETESGIQKIIRIIQKSPSSQVTKIKINEENYGVKDGAIKICEILFRGGYKEQPSRVDRTKNLASYFSTTQLLSQDQLHEFILASNPQDRFILMEKVLGLDKYGSDFANYLTESIQVIKDEKDQGNRYRRGIQESWLEVSTQLKEKELLLQKLGGKTEADLVKQMSGLIETIQQSGLKIPEGTSSILRINSKTTSTFVEIRQCITTRQEHCDLILLMLREAKPLFDLTQEQFIADQQRLNKQILECELIMSRRDSSILRAEGNKTQLESLIEKRKTNLAKQRVADELSSQIQQLEQEIVAIRKNPLVLKALEKFEDGEQFITAYIKAGKDYSEIMIKINLETRNISSVQLLEQLDQLKIQISDIDADRKLKLHNLDQVKSQLAILKGEIDSGKENTIDQMIHDIQHFLLGQGSELCPVCGNDFKTPEKLHSAVRLKWEKSNQLLSALEQEVMNMTSKKNEMYRDLGQVDINFRKFSDEMVEKKVLYEQNQLEIEQQRSLLELWKKDLPIEELQILKDSTKTFLDGNSIAYNLLSLLVDLKTKLQQLSNQKDIAISWIEEQKKLVGKRAQYLSGEEAILVRKIQKLDHYLLQARARIEQGLQQVKDNSTQLAALEHKWSEQELKAIQIIKHVQLFDRFNPKLETWIEEFNQQKSTFGQLDILTEQFLEKVEAFLTKGEVGRTRKQEKNLSDLVKESEKEIKHYEKLGDELESLKKRHEEIRSTIMKDYLINYSESIDKLFMQISPHAIFKHVHLVPKEGKLYILMSEHSRDAVNWATLTEGELAVKFNASLTFSSAQANVLAVCIFLSLALSQQWTPLELIGIDDPFQNMDDINVFSFIDVISQVIAHKQVLISSHNEDFVSLVRNKSGLEADQIGYIDFRSYSRDRMDVDSNCKIETDS